MKIRVGNKYYHRHFKVMVTVANREPMWMNGELLVWVEVEGYLPLWASIGDLKELTLAPLISLHQESGMSYDEAMEKALSEFSLGEK